MFEKFKRLTIPHALGLSLLIGGWLVCILSTGWDRWTSVKFLSGGNLAGLVMILLGAYMPEIFSLFHKEK